MRFLRTLVAVLAVAWGFPALAQRAPLVVTANPLLSDGRNFLEAAVLRDAGFTYEGIGRASSTGRGAQVER